MAADFEIIRSQYTSRRFIRYEITATQAQQLANEYITENPADADTISLDLGTNLTNRSIIQDNTGRIAGNYTVRLRDPTAANAIALILYNPTTCPNIKPSVSFIPTPPQVQGFSIRVRQTFGTDTSIVTFTADTVTVAGFGDPAIMVPIEAWADSKPLLQN